MLNNYKQNYRKNKNLGNWRKAHKTDQFNNNARTDNETQYMPIQTII
jgi:hypothetical protein